MNYEKELILMVGPIGSGKTTFAKSLQNDMSIRISQDEMGKKQYLNCFYEAIKDGVPRIIVDRQNFNKEQRERFIRPAREAGYCVTVFEMEYCPTVCLKRVLNRTNHPTVEGNNIKLANKIILDYSKNYERPEKQEYNNYNLVPMGSL